MSVLSNQLSTLNPLFKRIINNIPCPATHKFLSEFGFYDIFIVDPDNGKIVYSVFKELDFATSLKTGPYANTGIGDAFKQALGASNVDQTFITDFADYLPSYNDPASFISSPTSVSTKPSR
jgi:methyl-accepting chemotaxis protein